VLGGLFIQRQLFTFWTLMISVLRTFRANEPTFRTETGARPRRFSVVMAQFASSFRHADLAVKRPRVGGSATSVFRHKVYCFIYLLFEKLTLGLTDGVDRLEKHSLPIRRCPN